jgi:hypothetical protein
LERPGSDGSEAELEKEPNGTWHGLDRLTSKGCLAGITYEGIFERSPFINAVGDIPGGGRT